MISVILLSGGQGLRLGGALPKQYLNLAGKPIALHSFEKFLAIEEVKEIVVVSERQYINIFQYETSKQILFANPGFRRQDSVYNGIKKLSKEASFVLIHDAARPLIKESDIRKLILEGSSYDASALATPERNTLKKVDSNRNILHTIPREDVWEVQTPQMVKVSLLKEGLELALAKNITLTDDLSAAELIGKIPHLVEGSPLNIKITYPDDYVSIQNNHSL